MKTFIRYPGNKSRYIKYIAPHIPDFTGIYIEPFIGSGAVYLHLQPEKAILNDLNTDTINIWKLIKQEPEYILEQIKLFETEFLHLSNEEKLKLCKKELVKMQSLTGKQRTVMHLILSYCNFSPCILRNNKYTIDGLNAHLYGNNQCHIFTKDYFNKIRTLDLKNVKMYNKDYRDILKLAKRGDFIYLDPPYVEEDKYSFQYNTSEQQFNQQELKNELDALTKRGIKWILSQADTKSTRNLFQDYTIIDYKKNGGFNGRGFNKQELIIKNF